MKDNFSRQSSAYAKFRPAYPPELYKFIYRQVRGFQRAWDCGTGNGQVARELAGQFQEVYATDISQKQLDQAVTHERIHYSVQPAETADFPTDFFDLITVGQAIHWFQHDRFYQKVLNVLKKGGILAEFGYPLFRTDDAVNQVMDRFYFDIVGPYWDPERRHIEDEYARLPFPFPEIASPSLTMHYQWTFEHLMGYLTTWSSVQHYRREKGEDPVEMMRDELASAWGNEDWKTITYAILLRIGRKE